MLILHGILGECLTVMLSPQGEGLVLSPVTTALHSALLWQSVIAQTLPPLLVFSGSLCELLSQPCGLGEGV